MLEQLSHSICMFRKKESIPMINIYNIFAIKGWHLMRQACVQYGQQHEARIQLTFSGIIFWFVCNLIISVLNIFSVVVFDKALLISIVSDLIIFIVLMVFYFYYAARINYSFEKDLKILNENKAIVWNLGMILKIEMKEITKKSHIYNEAF